MIKIDLNNKGNYKGTAFHLACIRGNIKIVQMMIEKSDRHKIDLTEKDQQGKTGYEIAELFKNTEVVNLIKTKMPSLVVHA